MSKRSMLDRIRRRFILRDDQGAGALLPIIVVGAIIVTVAGSVASGVTFSSKISSIQNKEATDDSAANSLFRLAESGLYNSNANKGSAAPSPTASASGVGQYKIYYSTSTTAPTSETSSGVTALTTSGVPTGTNWIVVVATPTSGNKRVAVYSYIKKGSKVFDSAFNWTGQTSIGSNSIVKAAPGVTGPVSAVGRDGTAAASLGFTVDVANVSADLYSGQAKNFSMTMGSLRGDVIAKGTVSYIYSPKVYGDTYTSKTVSGTADTEGTSYQNVTAANLAAFPGQAAAKVTLPTTVGTLTASDCSSAALLKAKLESYKTDGTVKGVNTCAAASWNTTITPKANLVLDGNSTTANLSISNLTIAGTKSLSIHSAYGLTLDTVKYTEGATGQILSGGPATISASRIVGAIGNYGTAGAKLGFTNTTLLYSPVASNLCAASTGTCTISSTDLHLVRVS